MIASSWMQQIDFLVTIITTNIDNILIEICYILKILCDAKFKHNVSVIIKNLDQLSNLLETEQNLNFLILKKGHV